MMHDEKQILFHKNDPFLNLHVGDGTTILSFMSEVKNKMLTMGIVSCYAVCYYKETHCIKVHGIPVFLTDKVDGYYMRLFKCNAKEDKYVEFFKVYTGELYETVK